MSLQTTLKKVQILFNNPEYQDRLITTLGTLISTDNPTLNLGIQSLNNQTIQGEYETFVFDARDKQMLERNVTNYSPKDREFLGNNTTLDVIERHKIGVDFATNRPIYINSRHNTQEDQIKALKAQKSALNQQRKEFITALYR